MARPIRSNTADRLKGTDFKGKTIRTVHKGPTAGKRIIVATDGTRTTVNKRTAQALFEVQLDNEYKKIANDKLVIHKNGTASTRLGGPLEGETKTYSSKSNAKRAINNYYHEDLEKYKKGIKARSCRRREKPKDE